MSSGVQNEIRGDDKIVEVSGVLEDKTRKEVEVHQKVTPMPTPPPPFPQRLVKKIKDGKYRRSLTMFK